MLIALLAAQAPRGEVARRPRKVVDVDLDMVRLNIGLVIVDRLQRYGDAGQAFAAICYFPPNLLGASEIQDASANQPALMRWKEG